MSDPARILGAIAGLDFADWDGLPADLSLEDVAAVLPIDVDHVRREEVGEAALFRDCVFADLRPFERGVRVWVDEGRVVLLEAFSPRRSDGDPRPAPDLGPAEAYDDAMLGTIWVEGAERVYASRGLALRAHPETDRLDAVLAFAPTSVESYRQVLRPVQHPIRRLTVRGER